MDNSSTTFDDSKWLSFKKNLKKIGGDEVKKIIQYGRSTFYCPKLQNNK